MKGFVLHSGTELINPFKLLERAGIQHGWHVADLGCGSTGHFVIPSSQLVGADGVVYAVDIRRDVLEHLDRIIKQDHLFNITTVWSDIDVFGATRIKDSTLDLCLLINNLYISQNKPAMLREIARLTKPGGRVVIVEWRSEPTPIGPPLDHRLTIDQSRHICESPYLEFLDEIDVGHSHYGLLYERTAESIRD